MRLGISNHAAARYEERVRPGIGIRAARRELLALIDPASLTTKRPSLAHPSDEYCFYSPISDGISAVIKPDGTVATVLVRGGSGSAHRARRNERKSEQRRRKRARSKSYRPRQGRPQAEGEMWPA